MKREASPRVLLDAGKHLHFRIFLEKTKAQPKKQPSPGERFRPHRGALPGEGA